MAAAATDSLQSATLRGQPSSLLLSTGRAPGSDSSSPTQSLEGADTKKDWHSIVKDMLSIQLPSSSMPPRPIATKFISAPAGTCGNGISALGEQRLPRKLPELESLQSGSPKASRSPLGPSPRSSTANGLLLVRIDESEALDTSSDCGDVSEHGDDQDITLRQASPPIRSANEGLNNFIRRSRLAAPKASPLRTSGTGEEDYLENPDHRESDSSGGSSQDSLPEAFVLAADVSTSQCEPSQGTKSIGRDLSALAKHQPDTVPSRCTNAGTATSRQICIRRNVMRRGVMSRISDHGCDDDEEGRVEFAQGRLALDYQNKRDTH